jgi:LPS export ABC transporter permease LptG/LPS export ABC transporter permease LptF
MLVFPCMAKIDKLLLRSIVPPFFIALVVLTFVVFIHDLGKLSELLITRNASPAVTAIIAGTILPGILIFTLPLAYMVGVLIGLSGLSSESQIVALRACGVPMRRMLIPLLMLGTCVGALTGIMSLMVLPATNDVLYALKDRISLRQATAQVQPRVFNEDFPNFVFYLDDLSVDRQRWFRVFLVDNSDPKAHRTVLAKEGSWVTDPGGSNLQLHLRTGTIYEFDPDDPSRDNISVFASTDIPVVLSHSASAVSDPSNPETAERPLEQSTSELWTESARTDQPERRLEQRIELHRRIAIPFSVFPFALLGLALGISTQKGGRASGFVISLALVLAFYILFFNGLRLASIGKVHPALGAWGANILLALLGTALMVTAERGSAALSQRLTEYHVRERLQPIAAFVSAWNNRTRFRRFDAAVHRTCGRFVRFCFPKVLDLYISRGFLVYFLWSILVCTSLFVVLTLFDLLDDIIRNRIPALLVTSYFIYLLPQILMLVVPMAILLAILINFGVLEKHSEVTALKAGGWSLYRIGTPVLLMSGMVCVSMYLLQDYVLPYANIRQDSLRNVIKGRPAQTSMRPQRKWIFGESNRIFNYDYFDPGQNLFVGLNVFEIDLQQLKIRRRIYASRAVIAGSQWILEKGWTRDFDSSGRGFEPITKANFDFPERPSYFQKEIFQPRESAKLNYLELMNYINYLRKAGYNATELQVELYKKISFPLSCLVMALLGVPFSFSAGKKGAFFGITASVAIAISYWGVFSVFEQMGAYGLLVPLLAAWAPNMVFGAAGLALLFTIRT